MPGKVNARTPQPAKYERSHFLIQPVGDVWGDWRNSSIFFPLTLLAPWEAVSWKFFGLLTISTILHQFNPGLFLLVQTFPLLLYYLESIE